MINQLKKVWESSTTLQFAEVLSAIDDASTMRNFLRDVMTEKEIVEISARLEAARMLKAGEKYIEISQRTKLSSRTIARISDWLKSGCNGYEAALNALNIHHVHIPPARAD